jgi:hypothetical protein
MKKIIRKSLVILLVAFLGVLLLAPAGINADTEEELDISITPTDGEIFAIGQTIKYTATAIYRNGNGKDVTDEARWEIIGDPDIARYEGKGKFTGLNRGRVKITATYKEFTKEFTGRAYLYVFQPSFEVTPGAPGEETKFFLSISGCNGLPLRLEVKDDGGNIVSIFSIEIPSEDWNRIISIALEAGDYRCLLFIEDYLNGSYDFTVVKNGAPRPPVEKKAAPKAKARKPGVPTINELPLSSYEKTVSGFVTLFYNRILLRNPEKEGLDAWVARLESGAITGGDLVQRFIFGEECQSRISDYTNEQFITFLYKALFNRAPEEYGFNAWLARMNAGMTGEEVVNGFTHSPEFEPICTYFGIKPYPGYVETDE